MIDNEDDRYLVTALGAVEVLSKVIAFSIHLDADNELVKSAFQALLAIGPDGSWNVLDTVLVNMRNNFFHSSVVTPALPVSSSET
jgi:hypothetical protein